MMVVIPGTAWAGEARRQASRRIETPSAPVANWAAAHIDEIIVSGVAGILQRRPLGHIDNFLDPQHQVCGGVDVYLAVIARDHRVSG